MPLSKIFSNNWVPFSLITLVVIGLVITVIGQLGLDIAHTDQTLSQVAPSSSQSSTKSLETIEIAATGSKTQTIKDQYARNEKILANGLDIKILDFNKFTYTSSVNEVQEVYCAIGLQITNISDSEIKILPDFDFELVDGSPSGGILLTPPLVKSLDSKPELELVDFETVKLEPQKVFEKSIPFICDESSEYQLIIKTNQFKNDPMFKVVNVKLI